MFIFRLHLAPSRSPSGFASSSRLRTCTFYPFGVGTSKTCENRRLRKFEDYDNTKHPDLLENRSGDGDWSSVYT